MEKSKLLLLSVLLLNSFLIYSQISVMSFNIRLNVNSDGINAWPNRLNTVSNMLKEQNPDLIGMQEVLPDQLVDLKSILKDYSQLGVGRVDGNTKGEYCPVFIHNSKFKIHSHGDFSLSENPSVFGQIAWDAGCERIATWVILINKANQDSILFLNTHLDHIGEIARLESAKLILKKIGEIAPRMAVVVTGDFNAVPTSTVVKKFLTNYFSNSSDLASIKSGPNYTFHDFGRLPLNQRRTIDYIMVSKHFLVQSYSVITDPDSAFISDHHPVTAKIKIK